jgi:hypothetical protein
VRTSEKKAGLAVTMLAVIALPTPARAQSDAGASPEIFLHPRVSTVLHLPDEIEDVRVTAPAAGMIGATNIANLLYVQPRRGLSAGIEAWLDVKTATVHQRFRLRVVQRAADADQKILLLAIGPARSAGEPARTQAQPATSGADPMLPPPRAGPASERAGLAEQAIGPPRLSRFDLSIHAITGPPGFTSLGVAGFEPRNGLRPHLAFGGRFAVAPRGGWWAIEAGILWQRLILPVELDRPAQNEGQTELLQLGGSWLRMEVGFRGHLEAMWTPSLYAGLGIQAHFDRTVLLVTGEGSQRRPARSDMTYAAVVALGLGVQRQLGDVLLGLDVQMRQGVPADYRSVDVVLSVGCFLDARE